jgi:hypothetical protein
VRIRELAQARPLYGYRRIHVLLRRDGWAVNMKPVRRLHRLEGAFSCGIGCVVASTRACIAASRRRRAARTNAGAWILCTMRSLTAERFGYSRSWISGVAGVRPWRWLKVCLDAQWPKRSIAPSPSMANRRPSRSITALCGQVERRTVPACGRI